MEVIPSSPAPKRTRVTRSKSTASAPTETSPPAAKKPTARKKKTAPQKAAVDMSGMIATAAYYIAERRSFAPGHELEDWLEAEKQIKAALTEK